MKMSLRGILALSAVALAVAAVSIAVPAAEVSAFLSPFADPAAAKFVVANAVLLGLRADRAALVTRAADKLAEVTDGLAPEAVRIIETAHADLTRQITAIDTSIAAEEARAPSPAPFAWSQPDIAKVNARALAFGLTATEAMTVIGNTDIRSIDAATDALQNIVAARAPGRQNPHHSAQITRDEGDTLRTAVESAIALRANPAAFPANAPEREMARNYRGMSLLETARVFIEETTGHKLRGFSKRELATLALGMEVRGAGMHSTSDFANVLANVANKRLRSAYNIAPNEWKKLSRPTTSTDFKEKSVVQLSAAPKFREVREGAEYSYGAMTDGVEKYALATYGRIVAITRQTLINDDLSAFDRIPMLVGRAAADLEADTFWSILLSNPAMNDTIALFHASHGNLPAGSAIDEAGLTAAEKAMRDQRGFAAKAADREYLNLIPKYLVTGNAKKVEGQKMLTAVIPNAASGVNVFSNAMEQIVEARITGNKWFLSADPNQCDTIEHSYLEGEEGVFTEMRIGFEVDGIEIKARLDFAAKAIDWRGLVFNAGN